MAQHCGEDVRAWVLGQTARLTRGDVLRLAALAPEEGRRIVSEARDTGRRPRLHPGGFRSLTVKLPTGDPTGQAAVLLRRLEPAGARALQQALVGLLQPRA